MFSNTFPAKEPATFWTPRHGFPQAMIETALKGKVLHD